MTPEQRVDRAFQNWIAQAVWDGKGVADFSEIKRELAAEIKDAVDEALERAAVEAENNRYGWHVSEIEDFAKEKGDGIADAIRALKSSAREAT